MFLISISWTIGCGAQCKGGNKKGVLLTDALVILDEVWKGNGTLGLSHVDGPDIGPQELTIEVENGDAVVSLGEDDGEDYYVRSYANPTPTAERIEILGNLWDGRMVCSSREEIISIVKSFIETGDVSKDILS